MFGYEGLLLREESRIHRKLHGIRIVGMTLRALVSHLPSLLSPTRIWNLEIGANSEYNA